MRCPPCSGRAWTRGGQYLIPFICLLAALASFVRRRKRNTLFEAASQASGADAQQGMSWQEFQMLGFQRRGYGVHETGCGGADRGADLVMTKGDEKLFVQCKRWSALKVGVSTARELYEVMAAEGASGGVVTSGRFSKDAEAFAEGRNIRLMVRVTPMQLLLEGSSGGRAEFGEATPLRHNLSQRLPKVGSFSTRTFPG